MMRLLRAGMGGVLGFAACVWLWIISDDTMIFRNRRPALHSVSNHVLSGRRPSGMDWFTS